MEAKGRGVFTHAEPDLMATLTNRCGLGVGKQPDLSRTKVGH